MPNETTTFAQVTTSNPPKVEKSLFNLSTAQQIVQLAITIASVVIIIAGLWLASSLSPLVQDIALVKQAAADQDKRIDDMKADITEIKVSTSRTANDVAEIKGILQVRQSSVSQPSKISTAPVSSPQPSSANPINQSTQPVNQSVVVEAPKEEPAPGPQPESNPTISTPIVEIDLPLGGLLRGS